jgi:hypothetical protein
MGNILNITNGDCAVEIMQQAGIAGEFLPWRDVLHEGPVPETPSLESLSKIRAGFIAEKGWGELEAVSQSFIERDELLASHRDYDKVILWFEHDLYDQLQLLQILDWFQEHKAEQVSLSLICTEQYLGLLTPDEMASLFKYQAPVGHAQLKLAQQAWAAFREPTPAKWSALLNQDTSALPFLEGTIIRMLEEFPSRYNGLSRTEQQALSIIAAGEQRPGKVFTSNQALEDRVFMGDTGFWDILRLFLTSSPPLITLPAGKQLTLPSTPDQALTITPEGKAVLLGKRNWLEIKAPDRWIGGVHLTRDKVWTWDGADGIEHRSPDLGSAGEHVKDNNNAD